MNFFCGSRFGRNIVPLVISLVACALACDSARSDEGKIVRDADGDPLPPHAVMRLGSARWKYQTRFQSVHWMPDGKQLLVNCGTDGIRRLDAETGKLLGSLQIPTHATAISPDGKELVYRSKDGVVAVDPLNGKKIRDYPGKGWWLFHYSPSGKYLVSATQEDYDVIDRETGKVVVDWKTRSELKGFAFSADESRLYVVSYKPQIAVLDLAKKKLAWVWNDGDGTFAIDLALSPAGERFAVTTGDIAIVDDATGEIQFRLAGDEAKTLFLSVQFSQDGERLIGVAQGGTIYIWNVRTQKRLAKLAGNSLGDSKLSISPDGKRLALGGYYNSRVWIWDLEKQKLLNDNPGHSWPVMSVAYSHDGKTIATGSRGKDTQIWNAATGKQIASLPARAGSLLAFTDGGKNLVTFGVHEEEMSAWKLGPPAEERKLCFITTREPDASTRAFLSRNQQRLLRLVEVFEKESWSMEVLDFPSLKPLATANVGKLSRCGAITADGKLVAFASDHDIQLYDVDAQKIVGRLKGHTYYPETMAFTADGKTLVSGSCDRSLCIWDVAERKQRHALLGQGRTIAAVAISPNGRVAATCGTDTCREPCEPPTTPRQILFWDIEQGRQLASYQGHDVDGQALAFSPNGKQLASGLNDGTTIVWETPELAWK